MGAAVVMRARAGGVLLLALVLQAAFVAEIDVFGAHGEVVLLVPIVAGLTSGPERGAIAGFAAGIAIDLLVQTPFGLTALTYCLVGYGVGALQSGVLRATFWLPMVASVAGSAVGVVLFALFVTVIGDESAVNGDLAGIVLAVVLWNLVLVLPALRLARWVEAVGDRPLLARRA
jgi:rod shape-determining protein MreD